MVDPAPEKPVIVPVPFMNRPRPEEEDFEPEDPPQGDEGQPLQPVSEHLVGGSFNNNEISNIDEHKNQRPDE